LLISPPPPFIAAKEQQIAQSHRPSLSFHNGRHPKHRNNLPICNSLSPSENSTHKAAKLQATLLALAAP